MALAWGTLPWIPSSGLVALKIALRLSGGLHILELLVSKRA